MIPERHIMVFLCALCCFINYADRVNMSVAIIAMGDQYDYSVEQQGIIMSYFFLGYLPMQLGGAVLCRRFGGKRVLSYGAFLWSMFTFLTPIACAVGYYPLLLCRVLMGLSEGVAFPSVYHFLSSWVPANERGRSISLFLTGVHAGTTFALVVSPIIIRLHSWQFIFYSFGAAGLIWIFAWNMIAYDRDNKRKPGSGPIEASTSPNVAEPTDNNDDATILLGERKKSTAESDARVATQGSTEDSNFGMAVGTKQSTQSAVGFLSQYLNPSEIKSMHFILTNRKCLAICFTQALFGLVHYTILSWLPSYFKHVFQAETTSLSFTFVPYLSMALAANIGGFAADRLHERGVSLTRARKMVTFVANTGAATLLIGFSLARTISTALVCISLSMAFMSLNSGGFESCFLDMASPGLAGTFKAVANTMASFAGFVAIPLSTVVLRLADNSWRFMFASLSFWYAAMTAVFCMYGSSERVLVEEDVR